MGENMRTLLVALLLSGCATRVVNVPITVPCLGPDPVTPEYRYGVGEYPGEVEAAKRALTDLIDAKQYSKELQAQMEGCRK